MSDSCFFINTVVDFNHHFYYCIYSDDLYFDVNLIESPVLSATHFFFHKYLFSSILLETFEASLRILVMRFGKNSYVDGR